MIGKINNNFNFYQSCYNLKKRQKDPIVEYFKSLTLSENITRKEVKGESLSKEEREFKNNNIIIKDPKTILLNTIDSKEKDSKKAYINTTYDINKDKILIKNEKDEALLNKLV